MPIDIYTAFNRAVNSAANKSLTGWALGHPLIVGVLTVLCIVLIMFATGEEMPSTRTALYMIGASCAFFVVHDLMLTGQIRQQMDSSLGRNIINGAGIDAIDGLKPRPMPEMSSTAKPPVDDFAFLYGG